MIPKGRRLESAERLFTDEGRFRCEAPRNPSASEANLRLVPLLFCHKKRLYTEEH